ncbi:MAG: NfeD family protein [Candidatus Adiutrix sp.]|jgi:membrane protein implicated in regulation of membrane protease activity|nr:NfeD family protein [Candidatus Adiutrix sp.]
MEIMGLEASLFWFILGVVFLVLEALTPGFFLMFFGLGAWLVSALTCFVPLGRNWQWLIFIGLSVAGLLIFRRRLKSVFRGRPAEDAPLDDPIFINQYVGREVVVLRDVVPGRPGLAELNGSNWQARTENQNIAAGQRARVLRLEGLTLVLELLPGPPDGGRIKET